MKLSCINRKECPNCHKMIATTSFKKHYDACMRGSNYGLCHHYSSSVFKKYFKDEEYICPKCSRKFKKINGFVSHYRHCVEGKKVWNQGETAETDERIYRAKEKFKETIKNKTDKSAYTRYRDTNREKYLESCRKGGLNSARKSNNRSKNEIYFSELLKASLPEYTVKTNSSQFNGWDSDIVIEELKLAIQWNGIWHYKKVNKKHNFEATKLRDKFKRENIEKCGYSLYEIKDLGKYNQDFVENQYNIFLNMYFKEKEINKEEIIHITRGNINEIFKNNNHLNRSYKNMKNHMLRNKENTSAEKIKEYKEKVHKRKVKFRALILSKIHKLINSDIDFSKNQWPSKAAQILGVVHGSAWVKRHMPRFYKEKCYKFGKDEPVSLKNYKIWKSKLVGKRLNRFKRILMIHRIKIANIDFSKKCWRDQINEIYGNKYGVYWMRWYMPKFCIENKLGYINHETGKLVK